jgi:hypothetical protein
VPVLCALMRKLSAAGAGAVPKTSQSSAKTWNRDIIFTSQFMVETTCTVDPSRR